MVARIARPHVIAHRGASGYLPEHTLEAKLLAHWLGADYLEQDVVATRDAELVVFHDIHLEAITDVAARFPGRHREDGRYYAVDFQLSEIRELTVSRRENTAAAPEAVFPDGLPELGARFAVSTLAEEIEFIQDLNRVTGRTAGIYPELKDPAWHREHGIDLAAGVLEILSAAGYTEEHDPIYLQCFDPAEVRRLREELATPLKLVQLASPRPEYAPLLTPAGLDELSELAQGLGPAFGQLATADPGGSARPSLLFEQAKERGLELHPYTFRRGNLPPYADSLETLLRVFFEDIPVDGVFCDYPDVAVRVREAVARR